MRIPGALRRYSGDRKEFSLSGATVREALEELFREHPDLRPRVLDARGDLHPHLILFRNDAELSRAGVLDETVRDGDVLELVGAVEGG